MHAGTVELCNVLNSTLGIDMVPTVLVDYPTLTALASYLAGILPPSALSRLDGPTEDIMSPTADGLHGGGSAFQSALPLAELPYIPVLTIAAISAALPGSDNNMPVTKDASSGANWPERPHGSCII